MIQTTQAQQQKHRPFDCAYKHAHDLSVSINRWGDGHVPLPRDQWMVMFKCEQCGSSSGMFLHELVRWGQVHKCCTPAQAPLVSILCCIIPSGTPEHEVFATVARLSSVYYNSYLRNEDNAALAMEFMVSEYFDSIKEKLDTAFEHLNEDAQQGLIESGEAMPRGPDFDPTDLD